ncbi:MAG: ABC transporter ATP-binding protein [Bacteroidota bacterium]|nr:ABC transporter ATP-binding protein [Bacteroidota bacterium]MDP4230512.1 ABC transporter ATP-binding protein [Bacteroidota bacterium]MDP4237241.1 ABC transporter ATP-binding protein [Bacteroidota bacterium]
MSVIETTDLAKSYGKLTAVDGISMKVEKGELFCLVGPDGAGKSTIIRMLCGIIAPSSGTATVLGNDTQKDKSELVKKIGYLSQRFSLYGDLTVDENIEFFARIHHVREFTARREELLDFTRMKEARSRLADKLSGGMKQKLALACTLIHSPEVIFLDEPTTGVDPVSRRDFWKILSNLLHEGITIFMTTPYLDEAERCTRVAMMNHGKLLDLDSPQNIRDKMRGEVYEIICSPVREAYLIVKGWNGVQEAQLYGDRLNLIVNPHENIIESVIDALKNKGITISAWRKIPPRLENVFVSMMGHQSVTVSGELQEISDANKST